MPLSREEHRFPTRSYPYRQPRPQRPGLEVAQQGPPHGPLAAGQLYAFVLGFDPQPRPMPAAEAEQALRDPFAELLLKQGRFPLTLRALLAALDTVNEDPQGLPEQAVFLVADGGRIPWTPETAGLNRLFRLVVVRSHEGDARLMVSASTALDSEEQFLQLIGWDAANRVYHFYERRAGTWLWAGNSRHALAPPTRGQGPFDSHVNGALVMKELRAPWNNWHSMDAHIGVEALAPGDPLRTERLFTDRKSAHLLETAVVRPGIERWNRARLAAALEAAGDGRFPEVPQFLRQVLETTTVNLASADRQSAQVADDTELRLPTTFFLNAEALIDAIKLEPEIAPVAVPGQLYRASLQRYDFALAEGDFRQPGDSFFAFLVPEPAFEDLNLLDLMLQERIIGSRFAACLLMVDFPNPVFSTRRRRLMAHVPETARLLPAAGAAGPRTDIEARFVAAVEAAAGPGSPEAEFLAYWRLPEGQWKPALERRIEAFFARLRALATTEDGFDGWVRLAESRRQQFRDRPLAEFRLTTPITNIPPDAPTLELTEEGTVRAAAP